TLQVAVGTTRQPISGSKKHTASRDATTTVLIHSLLHEKPSIRQLAASLAFNLSMWSIQPRVSTSFTHSYLSKWAPTYGEAQLGAVRGSEDGDEEEVEWLCELLSAIASALEAEDPECSDEKARAMSLQVIVRLMASLANLLYAAPLDVINTARALDIDRAADSKVKASNLGPEASRIKGLAEEIKALVKTE
ncbi:hypothetical protein EV182_007516, partial [Spiromyces aspiralis]